ncbi:ABC transporter substrate-binding protein [Roseomonas alkaliterrae]|uniref:Branched-chain amino acid transport system substrate-binding protein n=1 Tax=Neoroseomonas alkaliterrae TaxID=1452450 RepID=A0A840Y6M9_9PROT|nr:ABC transporter substrate-binding protein [Neoroseomonas alkaliterrae]MBB5689733.1 branched-chain amino acid transport system substrate-binding protein [Neoroseomonas alkaliterrae]MBR0677404.1 ABC transporter substrate-binding protein [Neoroseomonas alkaliterrae]
MTDFNRRQVLAGAGMAGAALVAVPRARAQDQVIRIGVLADFSGPYRSTSGPTSLAAAQQAVEDLGMANRGIRVEVLQGDHQNRPDAALALARRWIDQDGVDMICEVNNSAIALAVANLVREKDRIQLVSGAATSALTGPQCSTHTIHWTYDTWMFANVVGGATVRSGGDSWYFITADYAFGHQLERDTGGFVTRAGGRVLGSARYPFPGTTDFSSFLLQAQASRAKVVGLAMAAGDMVNCVKQAHEFGLTRRGAQLAGMIMFVQDIRGIGLEAAQGMVMCEVFYHDLNDRTRALASRILRRTPDNMPSQEHAGTYSCCIHYLKAVAEIGVARAKQSGMAAIEVMKRMPTDDDAFGPGRIREDNRKIHPAYLFEVKSPAESRGMWDFYKLRATVPAEEAFRPVAEGGCPLVRG